MYVMYYEKIKSVAESVEQNGRLYNSFEEAKNLYRKKGIVPSNSDEISLFNSMIELHNLHANALPCMFIHLILVQWNFIIKFDIQIMVHGNIFKLYDISLDATLRLLKVGCFLNQKTRVLRKY